MTAPVPDARGTVPAPPPDDSRIKRALMIALEVAPPPLRPGTPISVEAATAPLYEALETLRKARTAQ